MSTSFGSRFLTVSQINVTTYYGQYSPVRYSRGSVTNTVRQRTTEDDHRRLITFHLRLQSELSRLTYEQPRFGTTRELLKVNDFKAAEQFIH